jgi:hypothetical protein
VKYSIIYKNIILIFRIIKIPFQTFAVTDLKIFGLQQQQQSTDFAKRRRMRRLFGDLAFDGKDSDTSDMSHAEVGEEDSESDEV